MHLRPGASSPRAHPKIPHRGFSQGGFRVLAAIVVMAWGAAFPASLAQAQEEAIDSEELSLLAQPDLSNPRAALTSIRSNVDQAYKLLLDAHGVYRADPSIQVPKDVAHKVEMARLHLRQAMSVLDLSQVPAANRQKVGLESVLLIKEILDRLPEISLDSVPGSDQVTAAEAAKSPIVEWRVPYSDIRFVKMTDGINSGNYLVSSDTITTLPAFYQSIKQYAARPDAPPDFFEFYALSPGDLLPPKWYLWIEELPDWTRTPIADQAVWQWVGLVLVLLVLFGGYWLWVRRRQRRAPPSSPVWRIFWRMFAPLLLIAVCYLAVAALDQLNISGTVYAVVNETLYAIGYLAAAWLAFLVCVGIAEWIISSPRINPASLDASLIRLVARTAGIAAIVGIVFLGATDIGVPLYGVVAGLGVGGLALGLAARPTMENLIGGLILHADKPVRVGDFCQFGDKLGTIEEIGLRSTRVRALDRTLVTVPNAEFSTMALVNYSRRDRMHLRKTIGLRYETTPDQMHAVLDRTREYLRGHEAVLADTVRIRFIDLGDYALGFEVYAYIDRSNNSEFLEIQEEILFAIMRIVEECGTAFAFPSHTTYYARDPGLPGQAEAAAPAQSETASAG
jgi:MscS family membrane protein